jgi:hypothetical protein
MPAQWVTIIRIGGVAARHVADCFHAWNEARTTGNPNEWDPDQWPAAVHQGVADLVRRLDEHASRPPVLFYCRYVDLWSSGFVFDRLYVPRPMQVCGPRYDVFCHLLGPAADTLRQSAINQLRSEHFAVESGWFLQRMHEALEAWNELSPDGVIVIVREVIGALVEDREIEHSLQELPDWL